MRSRHSPKFSLFCVRGEALVGKRMRVESANRAMLIALTASFLSFAGFSTSSAEAALRIDGQVQAGGGPVAGSTVTLWAGSGGDPKQMAQARTADDGSFALGADDVPGPGVSLYVIAKGGIASVNKSAGDNREMAFLAVLGATPPAHLTLTR